MVNILNKIKTQHFKALFRSLNYKFNHLSASHEEFTFVTGIGPTFNFLCNN
jgi:hypothetical protein